MQNFDILMQFDDP